MTYFAYGIALDSDLPLELPVVDTAADLVIGQRPEPVDEDSIEWFDQDWSDAPDPSVGSADQKGLTASDAADDSEPWCDAGRIGSDYYLSFSDAAEFTVSADGSRIGWFSFEEPTPTLTHLLLDHVIPRALTRRGKVVIHGSCISVGPGSCFAIIGDSGQGKSTLAAALAARGHDFLADDCVTIDWTGPHPVAVPAYPELRLDPASVELSGLERVIDIGNVTTHGRKKRMAFPNDETMATGSHRLVAAFVLRRSTDQEPCPVPGPALGPARSTVELLSHSFHLNDPDERSDALSPFTAIAAGCEVRIIDYHHSPAGLASTVARIEALATALA